MKATLIILALAAVLSAHAYLYVEPGDIQSDTWAAVDMEGRELPLDVKVGPRINGRFVGVFYYIWHGAHGYSNGGGKHDQNKVKVPEGDDLKAPFDISKILLQPKDKQQWGPVNRFHHWGEPLFGYYVANDEWVIRRHAQMLSDADVDVVLFDVTNGFSYRDIYMNLFRIYSDIRKEGGRTPQVAFLCNGSLIKAAQSSSKALFKDLYKPGKYKELWFHWKGKPLILGDPNAFTDEMKEFFTIRNSWAWSRGGRNEPTRWFGDGKDCWNWLDNTPQNYGWHESPDKPEQVPVATAQHPHPDKGKSYHDGKPMHPPETNKGHYFAEQWKRALEIDPEFILITQWNEWVAQRFVNKGEKHFEIYAGKPSQKGDSVFVDVYDQEYNRDIEPMAGGHADNYYYQMIDGIRRFKGARSAPKVGPPVAGAPQSLAGDDAFGFWYNIKPLYLDSRGDTPKRDHHGWGGAGPYKDESGRNDFDLLQVCRDHEHLHFFAKTVKPITKPSGENWMELFISPGGFPDPSWDGFQFRVRLSDASKGLYAVEKSRGGFNWHLLGEAKFITAGNALQISVPRKLLGACAAEETLDLCFKWSDNRQTTNAVDWLKYGDTAPNARFMYRYVREPEAP